MLKVLSAATLAVLFAASTAVIAADSSSQGAGSTPSAGSSSSPSGASGSSPSASGSSTSTPAQCASLTGAEKEKCVKDAAGGCVAEQQQPVGRRQHRRLERHGLRQHGLQLEVSRCSKRNGPLIATGGPFYFLRGKNPGGVEGDRTLDLRIANAALSHLSYHPGERVILQ